MSEWDLLIKGARLVDGTGQAPYIADLAVAGNRIAAIGELDSQLAEQVVDGRGLCLAPGFIDVHTHDDVVAIEHPEMMPKLSQGVTTVIVGNCGISASPAVLHSDPPDPMNLLGRQPAFKYPSFKTYDQAVEAAKPGVNVAALIGHTTLRSQTMAEFDRPASEDEIAGMRTLLRAALQEGAIGLSSGLAYTNAKATPSGEIEALLSVVSEEGGCYTTHMRNEREDLLDSIDESIASAARDQVPLVISHLKCADPENWGKSQAALARIEQAAEHQSVCCDCYPYDACSTTLDLWRVTDEFDIRVTWSIPHPEQARRLLKDIAEDWDLSLIDTAKKLMPAGAIYHNMSDDDVRNVVAHPLAMIGSDGLPSDPNPHPRLWGTFPRVLAHYCRDEQLLSLPEAVRKMTSMPAARFGLAQRGVLAEGAFADLTLFDFEGMESRANFLTPTEPALGIEMVVVNGRVAYRQGEVTERAGQLLKRETTKA